MVFTCIDELNSAAVNERLFDQNWLLCACVSSFRGLFLRVCFWYVLHFSPRQHCPRSIYRGKTPCSDATCFFTQFFKVQHRAVPYRRSTILYDAKTVPLPNRTAETHTVPLKVLQKSGVLLSEVVRTQIMYVESTWFKSMVLFPSPVFFREIKWGVLGRRSFSRRRVHALLSGKSAAILSSGVLRFLVCS